MKKAKLFIMLCITMLSNVTYAQEYAVDKGATWFSGMAGFSSQGGEFYSGKGGKRLTTVVFTPSFNQFVVKNFFIGASVELAAQTQGSFDATTLAVGPHLGVAAGNINSTVFPYFSAGIRFYSTSADYGSFFGSQEYKGTDVVLAAGVTSTMKAHIGLSIEGAFHLLSLSSGSNSESGNSFSLGIGITGLFFKGTSSKPVPENKK
jgi:hypothetical protein